MIHFFLEVFLLFLAHPPPHEPAADKRRWVGLFEEMRIESVRHHFAGSFVDVGSPEDSLLELVAGEVFQSIRSDLFALLYQLFHFCNERVIYDFLAP